jgi:hypothetical protein
LGAEDFDDQRSDELASAFITDDAGQGTGQFVGWAQLAPESIMSRHRQAAGTAGPGGGNRHRASSVQADMKTSARWPALPALTIAGLVVALLAGCVGSGSRSAGSGREVAPTSTSPATLTTSPASDHPSDLVKVLVRGTVRDGVEPRCRLLDTAQGQPWLLVGGGRDAARLVPGARVEVVGVHAAGQVSSCQQGRPLQVLSVRSLG